MRRKLLLSVTFPATAFALLLFRPLVTISLAPLASAPAPVAASISTIASLGSITQTAHAAEPLGDPARISIPSIFLDDPVQPLGLNAKGEMDVPSSGTKNVGWYEYGTIPGDIGSAVFDAHVFAAFSKLNQVKVGDDIYVMDGNGAQSHFRVYETDIYTLASVPLKRLFNDASGRYLNLITCAGQLTADHATYDHRLVVYAELVK